MLYGFVQVLYRFRIDFAVVVFVLRIGLVLGLIWVCFGFVLVLHCLFVLVLHGFRFGVALFLYWRCSGFVLVVRWCCIGFILVWRWFCIGVVLVVLWFRIGFAWLCIFWGTCIGFGLVLH